MPNPTIRRVKRIVYNRDGTRTEVVESLRANGDRSQMVFYCLSSGQKSAIWHLVYASDGNLVHGPELKLLGFSPLHWPPPGYELIKE